MEVACTTPLGEGILICVILTKMQKTNLFFDFQGFCFVIPQKPAFWGVFKKIKVAIISMGIFKYNLFS